MPWKRETDKKPTVTLMVTAVEGSPYTLMIEPPGA
jgi:hypothetical protein